MNARKAAAQTVRRRAAQRRRRLGVIAGGAAVLLVAGVLLGRPLLGDTAARSEPGDPAAAAAYITPVLGKASAPVTIIEYADFQCPSCGAFARNSAPELIRRYVDTGKAKLVWKNFAWIGNESKLAAQAASCAGDQGKFWEYHDYLYAHQRGENAGAFTTPNLKAFASALVLDRAAFDSCLDSGRYRAAIEKDGAEVRSLNLTGTPSFTVNGVRVAGTLASLAAAIDGQLAGR